MSVKPKLINQSINWSIFVYIASLKKMKCSLKCFTVLEYKFIKYIKNRNQKKGKKHIGRKCFTVETKANHSNIF